MNYPKLGILQNLKTRLILYSRLIFLVSLCSVVFVVVPNFYLYAQRYFQVYPIFAGWLNCAFALRSSFNVFLLGLANKEFVRRLREILYGYFI